MTDANAGADALSPIKRALLEIRELRARVAALEGASREPIAITGIGLRFPGGARDADGFATLLWNGVDAITPIPESRWALDPLFDADPDAPGKMYTRYGGFIDDVDSFDAEFFGVAPREAASMDPQQRLLLEVAWEALEDAGQSPSALMGRRAGVYLGISNNDYGRALFARPELIDVYFSQGNAYSVAAGRISYFLGAQGPAVPVDTACSSSLVALHLACQGLRNGECDLALVGGANVILSPEMNINFSKARMMAPDGRCKTFDARADGYVRSEGVAFLVLERLNDARARRRRIRALVRGSAINQDGRSNGLTAPNGPAQESVIRAALNSAGLAPSDIDYVEAHGTGTALGDPIEVQALGAALGEGRDPSRPLMVGSVKTNVGHLEAAAGIAGVVKAVLALERAEIPPHLNLETLSPLIDWNGLGVRVPTEQTAWQPGNTPRRAGVSSFGFSGTNAHVILEEAPRRTREASSAAERPIHILAFSARDEESVRSLAERHVAALDANIDVGAYCQTANAGRAHFTHRVSVRGATAAELRAGVTAFVAGRTHPSVVSGVVAAKPKVAFLFTGQGPQHVGMARALYDGLPVFREAFDQCAAIANPLLDRPLAALMYESSDNGVALDDARDAQPALFAVEYALASVWRAWGVEPAAVIGHSFGEYVAACVAGVFSLEDAMRIVVARTRLVHQLAPQGAMAAVFADEASVAAAARVRQDVEIAAFNGPDHVVISGATASVGAISADFEARGVRVKPLHVSYGSHSPLMTPVLEPYARELASVRFAEPSIPLVANLTGGIAGTDTVGNASYWRDHLRRPVRFADGMRALHADGVTHFVEVGPHPVLLGIGAACVPAGYGSWIPSLRRDAGEWETLLDAVQALYAGGVDVDWTAFDSAWPREYVRVPTYPFRKRRHWMDSLGVRATESESASQRWNRLARAMDRASKHGPLDLDVRAYPAAWESLARLTSGYAAQTLRERGLFASAGERRTLDEIMVTGGFGASYTHLVRRLLDGLVARGVLTGDAQGWRSPAPLAAPDMSSLWADAETRLAGNRELLAYIRHCGTLMSSVLTGSESPLETLFPGGSWDLAVDLYERSQTMRWINSLATAAFESISSQLPSDRSLRVLEVGGGTGGTTTSLLPVLPAGRTQYRFTDVSSAFLDNARARLGTYPFVEFGTFDVDSDISTQGYVAGSFDVIVASNAVHASRDLRAALTRLRSLLAPGGVLVLVESTTHHAWFDMTTGLIEGWQHFSDDLRGDHPLLDEQTWLRALGEAGFVAAAAWPGGDSPASVLGQHVIAALASGETAFSAAPVIAVDTAATPIATPKASPVALRAPLETALPDERAELLRELVRDAVVHVLRLDPADAPSRRARLMEFGLDSLMAVQLRNVLGSALGLERALPATLMFDHPTIDALAEFLEARIGGSNAGAVPAPTEVRVAATQPIVNAAAIASMSDEDVERLLMERLEDLK